MGDGNSDSSGDVDFLAELNLFHVLAVEEKLPHFSSQNPVPFTVNDHDSGFLVDEDGFLNVALSLIGIQPVQIQLNFIVEFHLTGQGVSIPTFSSVSISLSLSKGFIRYPSQRSLNDSMMVSTLVSTVDMMTFAPSLAGIE